MRPARRLSPFRVLIFALPLLLPALASAQEMREVASPFASQAKVDERLFLSSQVEPLEALTKGLATEAGTAWEIFRRVETGEWQAYVNRRTGRIEAVEGAGIPWLTEAAGFAEGKSVQLADLERLARAFLPRAAPFLGVDPKALVLNRERSGQPTDHLWVVDFDVVRDGLPIDGARVVFRVSHGSLIQFGTEGLPAPGARTPRAAVSLEQARAVIEDALGGLAADDRLLDGGSLHLLPFDSERGTRGLLLAWQFLLRRPGMEGTWRARVNAATGDLLELADVNDYAKVTGGVFPVSPAVTPEVDRPLPGANVTPLGICTNDSGAYNWISGVQTSTLNGCQVRIADACGAISQASGANGNIAFGISAGTNCTTPGHGGAGNTHAARTQFYHLNRAKTVARGWLPGNAWLAGVLTVNTNVNSICNAFWNGSTLTFYRGGGGCPNLGEMSEIGFHEYAHGLDANDGNGSSPDQATRETYGDFTSALMTHNSCIGRGLTVGNCGGFGDPCTSCTGARDIDWALHASATAHTVANFTQPLCPASATFQGPCGREGHCESTISSESLWDLAARDLPSPGSAAAWLITDRLWYLSRATATSAFSCVTTTPIWTSNGCGIGSLWRTFRAVDDDDANPTNGTPHSCQIFAAFNRHGIACPTDPGANVCFSSCAAPVAPTVTLTTGGPNQVQLSWSSLGAGIVYDVYASIEGCNSAFNRIANNVAGTSLTDFGAGSGVPRSYQVVAHPTGNESCASVPSTCATITP